MQITFKIITFYHIFFRFTVDPKSGEITVAVDADQDHTLLDRETQAVHFVALEAKDGGGLRTSVQLRVTLTDVNDNAPVIARNQYEGFINENEADMERELVIEVTVCLFVCLRGVGYAQLLHIKVVNINNENRKKATKNSM